MAQARAEAEPARGSFATAIVDKAGAAVQAFAGDPALPRFRELLAEAQGVVVIPTLFEAGFIMRTAGGSGVFLARTDTGPTGGAAVPQGRHVFGPPAFVRLADRSYDLDIDTVFGAAVLLVMTGFGMDRILSGSPAVLGRDLGFAAGPEGSDTTVPQADVLAFVRLDGASDGERLRGFALEPAGDLAAAFYGEAQDARTLTVEGARASHPAAADLRATLGTLVAGAR